MRQRGEQMALPFQSEGRSPGSWLINSQFLPASASKVSAHPHAPELIGRFCRNRILQAQVPRKRPALKATTGFYVLALFVEMVIRNERVLRMFAKAILFAFASAIILAASAIRPASAASCSEWLATCRATTGSRLANPNLQVCDKELAACKARCKAGNKVWIGPQTGKEYPVTSCN
jgi:hypothetical protein